MNIQDMVNLIKIKDFAFYVIDNTSFKLNKDQIQQIRQNMRDIDEVLAEGLVNLNVKQLAAMSDIPSDVKKAMAKPTVKAEFNKEVKKASFRHENASEVTKS